MAPELVTAAIGAASAVSLWVGKLILARIKRADEELAATKLERDKWLAEAWAAKERDRANSVAMRTVFIELERREGQLPSIPPPTGSASEEPSVIRYVTDEHVRKQIARKLPSVPPPPPRARMPSIHDDSLAEYLDGTAAGEATPPEGTDLMRKRLPSRPR